MNDELSDGRLIRILPDYEVRPTETFLAYPSVRFMRPIVRAFTDFAVPALRSIEGITTSEGWPPDDRPGLPVSLRNATKKESFVRKIA